MKRLSGSRTGRDLVRVAIISGASNAATFLLYVLLVTVGLDPSLILLLLYALALAITWIGNARWTFASARARRAGFLRFAACYLAVCGLNIALVDVLLRWGWHAITAQLLCFVPVAVLLYACMRWFVFTDRPDGDGFAPETAPSRRCE